MADRIADSIQKSGLRTHRDHRPDDHAGRRSADATRIVFVPWDPQEGREWTAKCQNWADVYRTRGKTLHVLNYCAADKDRAQQLLRQASNEEDAVIYIRGHGSASSPYITTRNVAAGGGFFDTPLAVEDACSRLLEMGLRPGYRGVIKFFFCYSGTVFHNVKYEAKAVHSYWKTYQKPVGMPKPAVPRGTSLARAGADYMRRKGLSRAIYYGYLGPLSSEMTDDPKDFDNPADVMVHGNPVARKQVLLDGSLVGTRPAGTYVRASAGRIRV